jgi:hypothetical protein
VPERVAWSEPYFTVRAPPARVAATSCPFDRSNARIEVMDAESQDEAGVVVAGWLDDGCQSGFLSRIAPDGTIVHRRLGSMIVDVAFDDDLFAAGWDADRAAVWRIPLDDSQPTAIELPPTGVHAEPERILPGPVVVGNHSPLARGVLDGWIVRHAGDGWTETIVHGGGYSGFADAIAVDGGVVAVGFASAQKPYQGWIVEEGDGRQTERRFGEAHEIPSAIARLPDGGFLVVGKGHESFATRFDASLAVVGRVTWTDPHLGVFEYAQAVVAHDRAWIVALHGTLRHRFDRVTLVELPLRDAMGPARPRPIPGATGAALVQHEDVLWLATAVQIPDSPPGTSDPATGPIAFVRVAP